MPAPYLPLADLARIYRVHPRTARRWAAQDRWRRTTGRPVRYSLGDAQRSYEARHTGRIERHLVRRYAQPERMTTMKPGKTTPEPDTEAEAMALPAAVREAAERIEASLTFREHFTPAHPLGALHPAAAEFARLALTDGARPDA